MKRSGCAKEPNPICLKRNGNTQIFFVSPILESNTKPFQLQGIRCQIELESMKLTDGRMSVHEYHWVGSMMLGNFETIKQSSQLTLQHDILTCFYKAGGAFCEPCLWYKYRQTDQESVHKCEKLPPMILSWAVDSNITYYCQTP